MRLLLSIILFTLLGLSSASPVRLRTRGGPGSATEEQAGPSEEMLARMSVIEYSLTKYHPKLVLTVNFGKVFELENFGKTKLDKKVLVLEHKGIFENYLDSQRRQFKRLGVLIALGCKINPEQTHYMVIEMKGEFLSKEPTEDQRNLLTKTRTEYQSKGMDLLIDGNHYKRYTFDKNTEASDEKTETAYPIFGAIKTSSPELPNKVKDAKISLEPCSTWVGTGNLPAV